MKKLIYVAVALLCIAGIIDVVAVDHLIINQVYFDPVATEAGGEAVELYNPTNNDINLDGFAIKTEASSLDAILSGIINAKGYYLVADYGWATLKDNSSWPNADHEEAITMYNTDSGIALIDVNNNTIDAVGWGDSGFIENGLYENMPTANAQSGKSIKRINFLDTNNNSADFVVATPDFYNSSTVNNESNENTTTGIELPVIVNVTNSPPFILSYNLSDDDDAKDGYQLLPVPAATKNTVINVVADDNDGRDDIASVSALITAENFIKEIMLENTENSTNGRIFSGNLVMDYFNTPANYNIFITAKDQSDEAKQETLNFEYLAMTAFDIDTEQIIFDGIKNKETKDIFGDNNFNTQTLPTIKNIGNTKLNIGVYSNNLGGLSNEILQYKINSEYKNITSEINIDNTGMNAGNESYLPLNFKLMLDNFLKPGQYTTQINVIGVAS